jgi:hypothetical protein
MRAWLLSAAIVLGLVGCAAAQSRLTLLHDALHLSAAQEDAWKAYQRALFDPQDAARARQTAELLPTLPTPRRLALIRAQMEADQQAFDRRAAAVTRFYDALTPDQQRTFDRQTGSEAPATGRGASPGP